MDHPEAGPVLAAAGGSKQASGMDMEGIRKKRRGGGYRHAAEVWWDCKRLVDGTRALDGHVLQVEQQALEEDVGKGGRLRTGNGREGGREGGTSRWRGERGHVWTWADADT
eukprot:1835743-Rhodomonas_salina.1